MSLSKCKNSLINFSYWLWCVKSVGYEWKMREESFVSLTLERETGLMALFSLIPCLCGTRIWTSKDCCLWAASESLSVRKSYDLALDLEALVSVSFRKKKNPVTNKEGKSTMKSGVWFT